MFRPILSHKIQVEYQQFPKPNTQSQNTTTQTPLTGFKKDLEDYKYAKKENYDFLDYLVNSEIEDDENNYIASIRSNEKQRADAYFDRIKGKIIVAIEKLDSKYKLEDPYEDGSSLYYSEADINEIRATINKIKELNPDDFLPEDQTDENLYNLTKDQGILEIVVNYIPNEVNPYLDAGESVIAEEDSEEPVENIKTIRVQSLFTLMGNKNQNQLEKDWQLL